MGSGHQRAAQALKKASELLYPGAEILILDTFSYASPILQKIVVGTYMEMLKMTPLVYGYLYRQAECGKPLSVRGKLEFNRILNAMAAPRLVEFIKKFAPAIIVCTHPFPLGIVSNMKKSGTFQGPLFAVVTDFTIHSFWIFPEVDYYVMGSEALIPQCSDYGIEKGRVCATGIPIDTAFSASYDKKQLRERLGLDPRLPAVLIMGGGLGMGPLETAVKALGSNPCLCQMLVVAGSNKSLREKLVKVIGDLPCITKVYGFVDNIHELMAASDLMVGKAGGLTCAEALATGLPVFIVDPLPGQEERNTEFILAMGAGVRVEENKLAKIVQPFLIEPEKLKGMASTAVSLGRPNAARDAVKFMAETLNDAKAI